MRHRLRAHKLGRTSAHRKAMFRNLVTSLLDHERVETTDVKAKELRRIADRMITLGKRGDLHARRQALRVIRHRDVAAKVFDVLAERYRERPGGYTRVVKLGVRRGDAAPVSIVELVEGAGQAAPSAAAAPESRSARKQARAKAAEETAARQPAEKRAGKAGKGKAPAQKAEAKPRKPKKPAAATRKAGAKKTATRKTTRRKGD